MPPKVSRIVSQPTKTIAKASANSSSKSSGSSSKTSSSSSVRKSTTATSTPKPTSAQKPRNVDHVDFDKTKTIVDAGVYHKPKPIAAATGRDPEPPKPKTKNEDYDPLDFNYHRRAEIKEAGHKQDKEHPEKSDATMRLGATAAGAAIGAMAGGKSGAIAGAAAGRWGAEFVEDTLKDLGEVGEKVWEKTKEVIGDIFRETTMNMLDEDNPMG